MKEKEVPEVERNDTPEADLSEALGTVVGETAKLFESLGRAVVTTMQDVSNLMVIHVDKETRESMDLLVDAGVAKNRHKAATALLKEGMEAKEATLDHIRETRARISELRQQMRSLVKVKA
jgi:hypothetical protein